MTALASAPASAGSELKASSPAQHFLLHAGVALEVLAVLLSKLQRSARAGPQKSRNEKRSGDCYLVITPPMVGTRSWSPGYHELLVYYASAAIRDQGFER